MRDEISIRKYHTDDYSYCRDLWLELTQYHQQIYDDNSIGGDDPASGFDSHLEDYGLDSLWVAEYNSRIVALIGLIVSGTSAEVEPIIVNKLYRNKGIGKELLQFMINHVTNEGINYLSIKPVARNAKAIKIFHEIGFTTLGHIELFMSLKEDEIKKWRSEIKIHDLAFRF